jgi:GNAT superfamily N-acetyltransferase
LIENYTLVRLRSSTNIKPFDCGNSDLDTFLFDDAKAHLKELLAVTYILESDTETIAYFSVLNDSIRYGDTTRGRLKRILKVLPSREKRSYKSHPAVKIGRLAVNRKYQRQNIGSELMDYIKGYFLDNNKTGCRFILVDALNNEETINFYQRNGFDFLTDTDATDENRVMFFDLIRYAS